jgi:N-sulfoglucosamine sulfohydrolase
MKRSSTCKFSSFIILFTCLSFNWAYAQKKPNILFIIADDAGTEMSVYGKSWVQTPQLENLAKDGLLFKNAFTPNAKCAPSRASIITGRNPWQLDEAMNHNIYFPPRFLSFPEVLSKNNYETAFIGKTYGPGKTLNFDGSQREMFGKQYASKTLVPPASGISAMDYAANFEQFLQEKSSEKSWFCWIGIAEPHRVFEYGSGAKAGKSTSSISDFPKYFPDCDTVRNDLLDYALEVEHMDRQIGKIVDALKKSGDLENTLIVFTSDHGMPFPRVKGNQYYNANHIPLIMKWPSTIKTTSRRVDDIVSFIDLAPTFLEVAGIPQNTAGMHPIEGKSLLPILKSKLSGKIETGRDYLLVGQERHDIGRPGDVGYPIRGFQKGGFLYLKNYETDRYPVCNPETGYLNTDGGATKTYIINQRRRDNARTYWNMAFGKRPTEELYDISKDPDCVVNLANQASFQNLKKSLKAQMEKMLLTQGDLRMRGLGHIYERYPVVENVNFYERYFKGEKLKTGWINNTDFEAGPVED